MTTLPRGRNLDATMERLRIAGGPAYGLQKLTRLTHPRAQESTDALRDDYAARLRELGYSLEDYRRDVAALRSVYLELAAAKGEAVQAAMQYVVEKFRDDYSESGERLTALIEAVRDWLPFVSIGARYVPLVDAGTPLPPLSELPELQRLPEMSRMARLKDTGPYVPLADHAAVLLSIFHKWRGVEGAAKGDPRLEVLRRTGIPDHHELRLSLYSEHPVLLLLPTASITPAEIEQLLTATVSTREHAFIDLVSAIIVDLESTIAAFRVELDAGRSIDWNRLEPMLLWAEAELLEHESEHSFLRFQLEELRRDVKPWTLRDTLSAACLVVAVVLTAASLGAGAPVLAVLTAIQLAVDAAGLAAMLYLTQQENARRADLNRFARVDAALAAAAEREDTGLMVFLGLLTLSVGGFAAFSVAKYSRLGMAKRLDRAARAEPEVTLSRFRVADDRPAAVAPAVSAPPASTALTDDAARTAEAALTRDALEPAPAPAMRPANKPAGKPVLEDSPEFQAQVDALRAALAEARARGFTDQYVDELADLELTVERTLKGSAEQPPAALAADEPVMAAAQAAEATASSVEDLQRAIDIGLAKLARRDLDAWLSVAPRPNDKGALKAFTDSTTRGEALLSGQDPVLAVQKEASKKAVQARLSERAAAGNRAAAADPRARYDPMERATHDPAELKGQRSTGPTRQQAIGGHGTLRSTGAVNEPLFWQNGVQIPEFDLQTARTGGIETVVAKRSFDETERLSITIEGQVLPQGIPREDYNASDKLLGNTDLGLLTGMYEQAHMVGAGFGDEAAIGITLAPRVVNQTVQNRYIEHWMRRTARTIHLEGGTVRYRIEATTWAAELLPQNLRGADFLRRVSYEVEVSLPNRPPVRIRIDVHAGRPPNNIVDKIEFNDSALKGLKPSDHDAYRRYIHTNQTAELEEAQARSGGGQ